MTIDCGHITLDEIQKSDWTICEFIRGSRLYKTHTTMSNTDCGVIVCGYCDFIDIDIKKCDGVRKDDVDERIHHAFIRNFDIEFVRENDFIDMIKEMNVFALEALFSSQEMYERYGKYFTLNRWKLRESFCKIASNSWVKAKKKMTIDKDYDLKCGVKSLFHSIRILDFGYQIACYGCIKNFSSCNDIWKNIMKDTSSGFTWEDFKKKYKPIYNSRHSLLVEECPKQK